MSRDYAREYAAARRRARERGFGSIRELRRLPRLPRTASQLADLPDEARGSRSAAAAAIGRSRESRRSLEETGAEEGVSVATIRYWFPDAVGHTRRGRTRPTRADRHLRLRPLAADGDVRFIETRGSRVAAEAYRIFGVQWDVLHGRLPPEALAKYTGVRIGGAEVVTDPTLLERLGNAGLFHVDELYRELLG